MKHDDLISFEAAVSNANPVPHPADLVDSPESTAVLLLVRQRRCDMTTTPTLQPRRVEPPRPSRIRAWGFAAAAFVLVLAAVGITVFALQGEDSPFAEQPVTTTTIEPPAPPVPGSISWTQVDLGDNVMASMVPLGDGFTGSVLRMEGGTLRSAIVVSSDGVTWVPVPSEILREGEELVWADGGAWGAIGEILSADGGPPEVLVHLGDTFSEGATGKRVDPAAAAGLSITDDHGIAGLAGTEAAVAVGYQGPGEEGPEIFILRSGDGDTWEIVPTPKRLGYITALGSSPSGMLLLGETIGADETGNDNTGMGAWLSRNGEVWTEVTVSNEFIMGVERPVAWEDGFLLSGATFDHATETATSHIWATDDAETWSELDATTFENHMLMGPLRASDAGLLAATTDESAVYLHFSEDGTTWTTYQADELFGSSRVLWYQASAAADSFVIPVLSGDPGPAGTADVDLWVGIVER